MYSSVSPYAYALDDPVNNIDVAGLMPNTTHEWYQGSLTFGGDGGSIAGFLHSRSSGGPAEAGVKCEETHFWGADGKAYNKKEFANVEVQVGGFVFLKDGRYPVYFVHPWDKNSVDKGVYNLIKFLPEEHTYIPVLSINSHTSIEHNKDDRPSPTDYKYFKNLTFL